MDTITFFTNQQDAKDAAIDLLEQAKDSKKPDLILFYATLKYKGAYQQILDVLSKEFNGTPQIGGSVDGMIFKNDMRTDGAALVLCYDKHAAITVKSFNENSAIGSAKKLAGEIKCDNGVVILHFPLLHVPDVVSSLDFWARGKYYSFMCHGGQRREYAGQFADYCDRRKIFYPAPTIIDIFARELKYKIPIIGINLMHTGMNFNSPSVFSNFTNINDGIAALVINTPNADVSYGDIFPEKGRTLAETQEIVREHFTVVKEFKANFEKNVLISLDNQPPVRAIEDLTSIRKESEKGLSSKLEDGHLQAQMPYILIYFNKKTNGIMTHAVGAYYPFDLFPFFFDTRDFSETVWLAYEPFHGKMKDFASSLYKFENTKGFKFFVIDIGIILAFEEQSIYYQDEIARIFKDNYFGLLTEAPSVYLPARFQSKNYLTETGDDIFFIAGGSNLCVYIGRRLPTAKNSNEA